MARCRSWAAHPGPAPIRLPVASEPEDANPQQNFRFYDNRQKYLMFVNTCSEKWVVANRVIMELATSIRVRRRCGCSTPAWATAPC